MFTISDHKKRYLLGYTVFAASVFSTTAFADPLILPPSPLDSIVNSILNPPPPVFCFGVTGGDPLPGGGVRLQFQVLNWTGEAAGLILISQINSSSVVASGTTGGLFTTATTSNSWTPSVLQAGNAGFSAPTGEELQGIDLDPNNDLDFSDAPTLPNPLDSGVNALDGFIFDFPELDVGERVVLSWTLFTDAFVGLTVDSLSTINPFSFGTFQIDRASNGSTRVATYFSIGTTLSDIDANPAALNLTLTEQNAVTLAAIEATSVPLPAASWLLLSGLIGFATVARTHRKLN